MHRLKLDRQFLIGDTLNLKWDGPAAKRNIEPFSS